MRLVSRIDQLLRNYERQVALPWPDNLAGSQRVWFAVYDKMDERRIRARIDTFELATKQAGHSWRICDLTTAFSRWMAANEYRDSYFRNPDALRIAISDFRSFVAREVKALLDDPAADQGTVVALLGAACLFGFIRVSELIGEIEGSIRGRLLVFFPGEYENNNYRLLDARDGWNYLAVPITAYDKAAG